jgi:hypothetical protein
LYFIKVLPELWGKRRGVHRLDAIVQTAIEKNVDRNRSTDFFPFLTNKNCGHGRLVTAEEFRLETGGRIFQGA